MLQFHDAVVLGVSRVGDDLFFEFENVVESAAGTLERGSLAIRGVVSFTEDGQEVALPLLDFDDGQVLELIRDEHRLTMVVEWEKYADRRVEPCSYEATGREIEWLAKASDRG